MGIVSSGLLMISGACLILGIIHLRFWFTERTRRDYLAFAIVCVSVAVFSQFERVLLGSTSPEEYNFYIRWSYLASTPAIIAVAWFAYLNLGGRRWLFLLCCGIRAFAFLLNLFLPPNINFREISSLGQIKVLGEYLAYPVGRPSPWMSVPQISQVILIVFCIDASIAVWRRGHHRRAFSIGGGIVLFTLTSLFFSVGVMWGFLPLPMLASVSIFFIIAGSVGELNYRLHSAAMLSEKLIQSQAGLRETVRQLSLSETAGQVGLWTRKVGDKKLWASAKMRQIFGLPESDDVTFDDFMSRVHPSDRDRYQATLKDAETNAKGYEMQYRLLPDDGQTRWVESRGRVEDIDQNSGVLRGAVVDITKTMKAESAVHDLSRRLMSAQEKERARLARELHDGISQSMALLSIQLSELRPENADRRFMKNQMDKLITEIERLTADIHRISHELHPAKLHQLGLESALGGFCRELGSSHPVTIEFQAESVPRNLPDDIALCVYRVTQEALQNIVRHSHATRATVVLKVEGEAIRLAVSDNGSGFNEQEAGSKSSLGLISMSERVRAVNGDLAINTRIGSGTKVEIRIPMQRHLSHDYPALAFKTISNKV